MSRSCRAPGCARTKTGTVHPGPRRLSVHVAEMRGDSTRHKAAAAQRKAAEEKLDKERHRVEMQRALWAALPAYGPRGVAVDALKKVMIDRAWQLLDGGQCENCAGPPVEIEPLGAAGSQV